MPDRTGALIAANDLEGLVEWAGSVAFDERWDDLVALRDDCRAALARGLQLWPAAAYAEYRLALDAPGRYVASVLDSSADRFALGPFPEVAASTHTWSELEPYLPASPATAAFAHERVMRGEDLSAVTGLPDLYDLPLHLTTWEPAYPLAEYFPDRVRLDAPEITAQPGPLVDGSSTLDRASGSGGEVVDALRALVSSWHDIATVEIDGAVTASAAVTALGIRRFRLTRLTPAAAMAWMGWAAATTGPSGRRRGAAAGRSHAWWAAAALVGLDDDENIDPDELGGAIAALEWYLWDDGRPSNGRTLRLGVADPEHGLAWAIDARHSTVGSPNWESA